MITKEKPLMKRLPRYLFAFMSAVFMITAYSVGTRATEAFSDSPKYIEVCSQGTVHVPPDTKFVTCHGRMMRVIAIVPLEMRTQAPGADCDCPRCCDGACAVTISCGNGGLCTMYLGC